LLMAFVGTDFILMALLPIYNTINIKRI